VLRRPPPSPLFPYTTLFRSTPAQLAELPLLAEYDTADGLSISGYNDFTSEEGFASAIDTNGVTRIVLSSSRHESLTEPAQNEYRSEEHTSELQSRENLVCRR